MTTTKENPNYCIYMLTSPSGKKYIGVTKQDPRHRWSKGKGYREGTRIYDAIQKYGWDSFKHEILISEVSRA